MLTAVKPLEKGKWLFQCSCGNDYIGLKYNVMRGKVKSCGCLYRKTAGRDLIGQKFQLLTAIRRINGRKWLFLCDCGNEKVLDCSNVINGHTKSCGCANYSNITGQRFGKLVAIKPIKTEKGLKWLFKCDCGNEKIIAQNSVIRGRTRSCGCEMGAAIKDISGQRFGRLVAIKRVGFEKGESLWLCKCDCGNFAIRGLQNLQHPRMHSCGCWLQEGNMFRKHSGCFTLTYSSWASLKARCSNPSDRHYSDYGGRGIKVCDRWLGEHGFENFLADMGERPTPQHSIDRIDVNGNYEPSNCRWATSVVQANNKRNNIIIEHNGETHSLCDWCRRFGVDSTRARKRYMRGLSFEQIFAKETLPKPGSKGALSDEEVRFIRNHIGNYDNCKSLFMKQYGKHIEMGMYYGIRARRSYKNVI